MTRLWLLIFLLLAVACTTGDLGAAGGDAGAIVDGRVAVDGDVAQLPPDPLATRPGVVVYWGQNGWGGAHPGDPSTWEAPLAEVCARPEYDVIVLSFVTTFVSARNGGLPETNFSSHCETPIDLAHPFLLACPAIADGVAACHARGKKVLLSLGGASGAYGFTDDAQARGFADTVWDMFLGGAGAIRPFGAIPLDGVDLDIEGGGAGGYGAFATALRARMTAAGGAWLITAAPQCPFPDAYVGPASGRALGDDAAAFDYVFVQFYNNYCAGSSGQPFRDSFAQWRALAAGGGPRVVVGLPATAAAAPAGGWVAPAELGAVLGSVDGDPAFAGVMLWDASFDQNSGSPTYGAQVKAMLP